jgi:iron complex outermembrane receptor protein
MRALILSLFIGLSLSVSAQQSVTIRGWVIDQNTQEPLEGVNIVGVNRSFISDAKGAFVIEVPLQSAYRFRVTHLGYADQEVVVDATDLDNALMIALVPKATSLEEVELYGKTPQQRAQELSSISVGVSKTFLDNNRENSLMQTLKKIPGVSTITIGSGQSKPVIRGLGFNRVSVVQNGIKHEAQQWGNDHGLEIDQYAVEDLQIIKGSGFFVVRF